MEAAGLLLRPSLVYAVGRHNSNMVMVRPLRHVDDWTGVLLLGWNNDA